jgi:alanine or glycine:cation symporter, AGCS family
MLYVTEHPPRSNSTSSPIINGIQAVIETLLLRNCLSRVPSSGACRLFWALGIAFSMTLGTVELGGMHWVRQAYAQDAASEVDSAAPVAVPEAAPPIEEPISEVVEEASDSEAKQLSIDKWIDKKFEPIALGWEGFVFTGVPAMPMVLLTLVVGAAFFTLIFGFPNIRLFSLAIRVVSGKYDAIEKGGAIDVKGGEVNEAGGDLVDTIRNESEVGEVSHFQALATAVSGTVGLGNISGVAVAVAVGGPGATFWMIVCGLLGMSTKFVECTLGVCYRDIETDGTVHGGPMYYLSKGLNELGFGMLGKVLGIVFAILCVGASFGGGNMFQSNQATAQIQTLFGLTADKAVDGEPAIEPTWFQDNSGAIIGIVMAFLVAVVIIGGIKRIATVTEKVVPLMAIMYIVAAMVIILMNIQDVPAAFVAIFNGAFNPAAGLGGIVGVVLVGFQRAAFSNEAGAGSAAIAHSAVKTRYPASEGIVALLEPFIDTVVICTMTALVIVLFNTNTEQFDYAASNNKGVVLKQTIGDFTAGAKVGGVDLTSLAFDDAIPNFRYVLTIAIILFAFSTMISWSYYGLQSWKYLFGRSGLSDICYKLLYCAFVVIGAAASLNAVITFSDAMILALVFPNMVGLLLLAPRVQRELSKYLKATGND